MARLVVPDLRERALDRRDVAGSGGEPGLQSGQAVARRAMRGGELLGLAAEPAGLDERLRVGLGELRRLRELGLERGEGRRLRLDPRERRLALGERLRRRARELRELAIEIA